MVVARQSCGRKLTLADIIFSLESSGFPRAVEDAIGEGPFEAEPSTKKSIKDGYSAKLTAGGSENTNQR